MADKVLGDYNVAPGVDDALNYQAGDSAYMVLTTEPGWDVYGRGEDAISFTSDLSKAHSGADWAGTAGKGAIVVDLANLIFGPWDRLPVVYDNEGES